LKAISKAVTLDLFIFLGYFGAYQRLGKGVELVSHDFRKL